MELFQGSFHAFNIDLLVFFRAADVAVSCHVLNLSDVVLTEPVRDYACPDLPYAF